MRKLLLISLLLIISINTHATHAAGMDISYECISQGASSDTYKITLKFSTSGDLLGVYANNQTHERLYSIAKINNTLL